MRGANVRILEETTDDQPKSQQSVEKTGEGTNKLELF